MSIWRRARNQRGRGRQGRWTRTWMLMKLQHDPLPQWRWTVQSTPPSHRQSAGTIRIKPISTPFPTTPAPGPSDRTPCPGPPDHTTVSATPCEKCARRKSACVFKEGAFACVDCQRLKRQMHESTGAVEEEGGKPTSEVVDRTKTPLHVPLKTL